MRNKAVAVLILIGVIALMIYAVRDRRPAAYTLQGSVEVTGRQGVCCEDGSYWVRYVSANQTKVYILVDMDGNVKKITIDGTFAERYGEWTRVKDAALSCERLGLDSGIRSEFAGGDCSSGTREDYDWGYVMAGNMNTVFIWIEWNEPLAVYGE